MIQTASHLLSQLTQFAGVVMTPRRAVTFKHIEFLKLSEKRILLIVVTPDGDVQNRILFTELDYRPVGADRGGELTSTRTTPARASRTCARACRPSCARCART